MKKIIFPLVLFVFLFSVVLSQTKEQLHLERSINLREQISKNLKSFSQSKWFYRKNGDQETYNLFYFFCNKEEFYLNSLLSINLVLLEEKIPNSIEEEELYIKGEKEPYFEDKYSVIFQKDSLVALRDQIEKKYLVYVHKIDSIIPKVKEIDRRYISEYGGK